jgi:hypothetical protein
MGLAVLEMPPQRRKERKEFFSRSGYRANYELSCRPMNLASGGGNRYIN